ncbi:class I adenylate-forming enzyme family protein [Actinophytocola sp.]|uniref:class I adenylate-forming enzyme family protein n=1 Tax=Actinophytocola sp. TaxID=1872138 RepID=UPI003D6BBF04
MDSLPGTGPDYVLRALELFAKYGDREALVVGETRFTYTELRAAVLDIAANLVDSGLRPGATVAIMLGFPPQAPMIQLALHLLGCRTAWVSNASSVMELAAYLDQVRPEALLYEVAVHEQRGRDIVDRLRIPTFCVGPGGAGPDVLAPRPTGSAPFDVDSVTGPATGTPESVFQTSGTTGIPKPLLHTANLYEQILTLAEQIVAAGEPRYRHLSVTPMWFVAGQTSAFLYLFTGGTLLVMRFFRAAEFLELLESEQVNSTFITPLMLYELLDHPEIDKHDLSAMVVLSVGTAATNPVRLRQAVDRFGPVIRITYGLSESPFISAFPGVASDPHRQERVGSCGPAYGDVRLQIRGEDGTVLPAGGTGELWVASRLNFAGYVSRPEQTAETLVDGWVRTGDLGYVDDEGYIYLTGRVSDVIITTSGSYHIFPRAIEDALTTHPQVRAAAVIGVPHPRLGEAAHAYVVLADGATVTEQELIDLVTEKLTWAWAPRSFDFVDDLPRTGSGKTNTRRLREEYAALHVLVESTTD